MRVRRRRSRRHQERPALASAYGLARPRRGRTHRERFRARAWRKSAGRLLPCGGAGNFQRQGYAVRALGDRGAPRAFRLGLFSRDAADIPRRADRRHCPRGGAARHSGRPPCIGHGDHRGTGRRAYPYRQADLLHLGRFGLPDRRARNAFRAGAAVPALRGGSPAGRSAQYRARHRPPLHR